MPRERAARRRPSPPLSHLLFLATTASAVSLANFQIITDPAVPLGCIAVYNQQFFGCTRDDFQARGCSSQCREGVAAVQSSLQRVCGFIDQPASSFLGTALRGGLLQRLCIVPASTTGAQRQTQTSTTVNRATQVPTTTNRGQVTSTTVNGGNRPISTTNGRGITQTIGETSSSAVVEQPAPSEVQPTPDQQASPALGNTRSTTTNRPAAQTPEGSRENGGGSPFDNPVRDGTASGLSRWSQGAVFVVVVGYLIVW